MSKIAKFFKLLNDPTPHKLGPEPEEVFGDNVAKNAKWFLPLLTVDLHEINPEWNGKAHFVYHEANREEGVTFQLENDHYIYKGEYDFDEDGMAGREVKKGFIKLVPIDVPELTEENQFDWLTGVNQTIYEINEKETGDIFEGIIAGNNYFGLKPWWVQWDATPKNPDGEPMQFIGQITAMEFSDEVGDKDIYLFYCPKYKMVTQIDQCT